MKAPAKICIVCHREDAKQVLLPSGAPVLLCAQCAADRFRISEAERRRSLALEVRF